MFYISYNEEPSAERRAELLVQADPTFTRRFARAYELNKQIEWESGAYTPDELEYAHSHGFTAETAAACSLNNSNLSDLISNYDYARLWPINNAYRIWVNDKLTLRHVLPQGPEVLPRYYYYTGEGCLAYELDCPRQRYAKSLDGLLDLLHDEGILAMKCVQGSGSVSFFKLQDVNGTVEVNGQPMDRETFSHFISTSRHCIITEYLRPEASLARIHPDIHTLRLIVINEHGDDPTIVCGYIRFGMHGDGGVNYDHRIARDVCNYYCRVNVQTGAYGQGLLLYPNKVVRSACHPSTQQLAEGVIPNWKDVVSRVLEVSEQVGTVEWMGFDVGITEQGMRLMEINSHPAMRIPNMYEHPMRGGVTQRYLSRKLGELNTMSGSQLAERARTIR